MFMSTEGTQKFIFGGSNFNISLDIFFFLHDAAMFL